MPQVDVDSRWSLQQLTSSEWWLSSGGTQVAIAGSVYACRVSIIISDFLGADIPTSLPVKSQALSSTAIQDIVSALVRQSMCALLYFDLMFNSV